MTNARAHNVAQAGTPDLRRRRLLGCLAALPLGSSLRAAGPEWDGMADSAAWRQAALERIESGRKGDFAIRVTDAAGQPLANAAVQARLQRHDFGFGAAVRLPRLFGDEADKDVQQLYRAVTATQFHKVVPENAFKWRFWQRQRRNIDAFLNWADGEALPVRGHTLVWPGFRRMPDKLDGATMSAEELDAAIRKHVRSVMRRHGGRVAEWDVLNEPFTERDFSGVLGDAAVSKWFRMVRRLDPDAVRYINDFGVLTRPSPEHVSFYHDYIAGLLKDGVPLQGIGFQSHIPAAYPPTAPGELLKTLDRFGEFGLPMQVTEFDFETEDRELQARYTADFLIAIFSHPQTVGLLTWTPFEYGASVVPKPAAAMYDRNLRARPNAAVWDELVNRQWRSDVALHTDSAGIARFRGFKGLYELRATAGTASVDTAARLADAKATAEISL